MFLPGEDDSSPLSLSVTARVPAPKSSEPFPVFFAKGVEVEETEAQMQINLPKAKGSRGASPGFPSLFCTHLLTPQVFIHLLCQELL